jgi:hypothetical protein
MRAYMIRLCATQDGEPSHPIVGPSPYGTMREWVDAVLNTVMMVNDTHHHGQATSSKPLLWGSGSNSSDGRRPAWYTDMMRSEDMRFLDDARRHVLSRVMRTLSTDAALPHVESKAKKLQKCFQHLAQNLMGHERNYRALLILLDKVTSVITRIHCVEKDVEKTVAEMQALLLLPSAPTDADKKNNNSKTPNEDDNPTLAHVSWLTRTRMESVERHYGREIQQAIDSSRHVLGEKRKLHETHEFLLAFADFVSRSRDGEEEERMGAA